MECVTQLSLGVAGVQRDQHETACRDGEIELQVAVAVRSHDCDPCALRQIHRAQRADQAEDTVAQLGMCEPLLAADDRGVVSGYSSRALERTQERPSRPRVTR